MPFIGNQPALSYTSFAKQDFTTSATTSYTLSQPVANENEIALFINFVRQEPTTAYTASGTSLTLTSATSASDDMYAIFLGKAVQTVNPPAGSVGTAQIADLAVTSGKLASGVLPTNTPAFSVYLTAATNLTNNTLTKVSFDTENYDTNNAVSSGTFTVPAGQAGKYFIYAQLSIACTSQSSTWIYKNGSIVTQNVIEASGNYFSDISSTASALLDLTAGDYIEIYGRGISTGTVTLNGGSASSQRCTFSGYKLIG